MLWKSKKRTPRVTPEPRLLPDDAYPTHLDETGKDRADERMRERLHTIPVEPAKYLDNEGEPWILSADGRWTDKNGTTRSSLYTPIIGTFGPMVRVEEEPTTTSEPAYG